MHAGISILGTVATAVQEPFFFIYCIIGADTTLQEPFFLEILVRYVLANRSRTGDRRMPM